jgi:hypothetical protein
MSLTLARIFKYNVGIKYNNIMDTGPGLESKPGPVPGQKRKSQSSENEWVEYWSPRKNHKYWHNPSTGESVWKKPSSPAQPAISSSSLPPGLLNQPFIPFKNYAEEYSSQTFEDFLKKYEEYNKSSNNIDGIHFAKGLITSILEERGYKKVIEYVSDLLKSYISYKLKTSGSNLTIRDILEFNVHGTGHGGEDVAMPKDINPQYAPDKIYITAPPNIFTWGSQMPISKEYSLRQHYNGNKLLLKRNDKKYFRERLHNEYARIEIKFGKEMKDIELSLTNLNNTKEKVLTDFDENPEAKINVLGRISRPMACCSAEWREYYKEQRVTPKRNYTKKDVNDVEELFSMAQTFLNKKKTDIQEKYTHGSLGVERSMAESFKCYDSTRLTDKRNIGQCIQTLSSGPYDWQHSYPNFDILFSLHTDDLELNSMINTMLDIMQSDNNNLFENREGYKLNEKGFPFLMIEQLYKAFLNKSPDYRKISQGNSIYPAKLFDLLGEIGKVSIYGSFCCREGHKLEMDPYDSEGGRKKTRKRIRGNKRSRAKTRGRK